MTAHDKKRRLWDIIFGSGSAQPVSPWSVVAADTFDAPDNTPVVGRSTPIGAITYTDKDGFNPDIRIRGGRATFQANSYGNTTRLLLGDDHVEGLRVSFDYELYGAAPQVGSIGVMAGTDWSPHSGGIVLDQNGGMSLAGSVAPTDLVGQTSGLPASGRLVVEWGSVEVKISINGAQVATCQMSSPLKGQLVDISLNSNAAAYDNLLIEAFNAVPPLPPMEEPNASDPVYKAYSSMMPTSHVGLVRVGPARSHTTIASALETVQGTEGRVLLILDAASYNEQVWLPSNVDIAGATGDPADVVIEHICPEGFSPLNTTGGPIWVGGVTCRLLEYPERAGSGVYSVHHHGGSLSIFENVVFDGENSTGSIGMDGDQGSATWLVGCEFRNEAGRSDQTTNMHGSPGNTQPLRLVYDNCITNGLNVNYSSLDTGAADEVYVRGAGTTGIDVRGTNVVARIDPLVERVTTGDGVTVFRTDYLPDRPVRGV